MALKILLADDSMTAQNMGKKILLDAGYEVVAVSNGAAAIKKISSDRPDIIILDVYMPGYTGLEVCERVKGAAETSRTPVLLTVGKMEPFKPEEANRVRADGVMIKPFEATDLITAIQGIANKMSSSAPPRNDTTIRVAPPVPALDHTIRISPPHDHQDTVRIPPPRDAQSHPAYEETLRLTPEQIRAFQDKSYKDWVASAEVETDEVKTEAQPAEAAAEMPVQSPVAAPELAGAPEVPSILEPMVSAVVEEEPAMPIMPGLDSTEAPIARAMAGKMGQDFFTVASGAPASEEEVATTETPAFFASSVEHVVLDEPSQPVFSVRTPEPELIDVSTDTPIGSQAASLELETSAPLTPGPSFVAPIEDLEPTIAAPEAPVVAEVAPELEINSPIHLQESVEVTTDAALVTNDDDMSQFVTKFGQEGAEEVHVGVPSDLPPEQFAALTMPAVDEEIRHEIPQLDVPEVVLPPMVAVEMLEPVVSEAVVISPELETPFVEAAVDERPTNVLGEVGAIEPEAALSGTGPMVAYVPGIEDTQPIPAFVVPSAAEPEFVEPESAVAHESGLLTSAIEPEPVIVTEPETVAALEPEPVEQVMAVAAVAHEEEKNVEPEAPAAATPVMEAAAAAAVGGAALAGAAHFFSVTEPEPVYEEASPAPQPVFEEASAIEAFAPLLEEPLAEAPAEVAVEPVIPVAPEEPHLEPIGDAALAEELAAALARTEAETQATAAADAAIASTVEPVTEALESSSSEHMIADAKLSDAVSRALEKLRPQLIAEIMKELFK